MKRALLCFILFPLTAMAEPCQRIKDDGARLACYEQMAGCLSERSTDERLACFDQAMQASPAAAKKGMPAQVRERVIAKHASKEPVTPKEAEEEKAVREFGKPEYKEEETEKEELDAISSEIVEVQTDGREIDYLSLANGQVWRETTNQSKFYEPGDRVTIKKRFFGFSMVIDGQSKIIKVRRVK